ncbi:ferritin-like domain-containing protein [Hymenobacter sp. 5516J-16]|uniref:ferritin-like domain-containing protein n=1 Tax=Hymenobacter sp. 5516J-16 TaxID=2932253 RepID=UPI001FD23D7C|nr:ferritin-like domain-containing protein [Hymenobacter sp. 5516J-16]UOQ77714.1 ferritin-like domain-containing protein [Hymenobacter sp. 5516J-16]
MATPSAPAGVPRRDFLRYTGAGAALAGLFLAGCDDDTDEVGDAALLDVGTGDTGILNYAYALEQLEAAFYAQIKNGSYYKGLAASSAEKQILDDLALHEQAHADFFKAALAGNAIKALEPDFSKINFDDRGSVLTNAQAFEDLGVAAYNGAGRFIQSATNLTLAGKIVSVEARHAALIRDLRQYNSFVASDVVDVFTPTSATSAPGVGAGTGKERSKRPQEVLATANQFLKAGSRLSATNFS